jgi:alkylation response protein AidB-like acyl-CoA dehydrogenase
MRIRTDDEAVLADVPALLAERRFSDALVPAALQADRLGVRPRSLTFLAEIVRRGGAAYAAGLPEPLPVPAQAALVRPWLAPGDDERLARWLDGVAAVIETRRLSER